ncbi:hypothetical protein LUZ60_016038 [Juncus effusus]|nr:hypothetical protein LUZ60_016038 [Juncus effusus]
MGEICLPDPEISRDEEITKSLNMTVLRRRDPYVEDILITAPHVVMYEYDLQLNQWNRKDVEGSLFVVKRTKQPRFQLIVMNRRNTDNLVEDLLGKLEFEMEMPYLMYKNNDKDVNGIWFYQPHCCQAVFDLFNRLLIAYKKAPPKRKLSSSKSEFGELEVVPTEEVIDNPLEPNAMSAPFRSFFSNISANGKRQSVTTVDLFTPHERPHQQTPKQIPSEYFPPPPHNTPACFETAPENPRASNFTSAPSDLSQFFNRSSPSPHTFGQHLTGQSLTGQHSTVGAPFLQPFPPPKPPASLAQNSNINESVNFNGNLNSNGNFNFNGDFSLNGNRNSIRNFGNLNSNGNMNYFGPVVNRESVRNALTKLAQNENYVEMVYQEILKAQKDY